MKKTLLFLLVISFSFIYCHPQSTKTNESYQIKKELIDSIVKLKNQIDFLENKLTSSDSVFGNQINLLVQSLDSTKKSIDETRLRESLKSSESTLIKQNYLIDGYSYIIAGITILIAILTIAFSILLAKSNKQAEAAINRANIGTDRLNDRMDYFDDKINKQLDIRFRDYESTKQSMELEEIYRYLTSKSTSLIKIAIEKLSFNIDKITPSGINRLIDILLMKILNEEEKTGVVELLIQKNCSQVVNFLKTWDDVKIDNVKMKNTLFNYYITNNYYEFVGPITHFILEHASPHIELNNVITNLSSHPDYIYYLINYEPLIRPLTSYSKSEVRKFIKEYTEIWNLDKDKISDSFLFANHKK